jgi:hypothetical protein
MIADPSLIVAALLATSPAGAPDITTPRGASVEPPPTIGIEAKARVAGGGFSGQGVRPGEGAVLVPSAELTGSLERGPFRLEVPVSLVHEQTMGAHFPESRGQGGLQLSYEPARPLTLSAEASLTGVWRPGWLDLYQPEIGGGYLPTDRYSHWDLRLGAGLHARPLKGHRARLAWRFTNAQYAHDPAYVEGSSHLAPLTYDEHALRASWRYLAGPLRIAGRAEAFLRRDHYLYARDAGTGSTHAGAGGPPPNPWQVRRGVEPGVEVELEPRGANVEASVGYGYEMVEDIYQGYYSFAGHHPEARVKARLGGAVELGLSAEAWFRRFGPGSYQEGAEHPPLLWGNRREDTKSRLALEARVLLSNALALTGEARFASVRTNLPPYEPGIYPVTREYDIDWSYTNWRMMAGVEWTYEAKPGSPKSEDGS